MLSKFYCDGKGEMNKADTIDVSALNNAIKEIYSCNDVSVERIFPGGTLGVFFQTVIDGKRLFIKTCAVDEMCRINLHKEIEIMKVLYEGALNINSFCTNNNGVQKEFMVMDFIDVKSASYEPKFVDDLIREYEVKLNIVLPEIVNYNSDDLYRAALTSFETLCKANQFSAEVGARCESALKRLKEYDGSGTLCHGDLSNVNIMIREEDVLVLDWEDALMAYPEYDILYWLTFYSQRKYYNCHLFEDIGVKKQYGKDIMVMILLIKCYLSYRNKSYINNKLSINDRINEIINM